MPCLQGLTTVNAHVNVQENESCKLGKEGGHGKQRASTDAHSNIFVLRKMVEEVFSVLYSKGFKIQHRTNKICIGLRLLNSL